MVAPAMLSSWEFEDTVERLVDATQQTATDGVRRATFRDVPFASGLILLRGIPLFLRRRRLPSLERSFYGELVASPGFVELSRDERSLVVGYVGRPWTPSGYAKVVTNFVAVREGSRTRLRTTTRIHLTDERSRRAFRLYWLVVHPGSLAVRRSCAGAERWAARAG